MFWLSESEPEGTNEAEKFRLGNMKSSNPFVVMNEALAENLGRPMFEKNVAPRRLVQYKPLYNIHVIYVPNN